MPRASRDGWHLSLSTRKRAPPANESLHTCNSDGRGYRNDTIDDDADVNDDDDDDADVDADKVEDDNDDADEKEEDDDDDRNERKAVTMMMTPTMTMMTLSSSLLLLLITSLAVIAKLMKMIALPSFPLSIHSDGIIVNRQHRRRQCNTI